MKIFNPENSTTDSLWALLVFSHDGAIDLWPIYFHTLFTNLDNDSIPVYLLSNYCYYDDPRVTTICVGKDQNWGGNMRLALPVIKEPYILYVCEDYFISGKIDVNGITELVKFLKSKDGIFMRMCQWEEHGTFTGFMGTYEISPQTKWMAHLQAGLWNREKLLGMAVPGHNPWQAESHVNRVAKQIGKGYFSISKTTPPIFPYFEGVRGSFWKKEGVDYFKRLGIALNLKRRPCPPAGQQWHRKFYRSILKRKMETEELLCTALNIVFPERRRIQPLKMDLPD